MGSGQSKTPRHNVSSPQPDQENRMTSQQGQNEQLNDGTEIPPHSIINIADLGPSDKGAGDAAESGVINDVMISYSHSDKVAMESLRDYLKANKIQVWVDVSGLAAGVDFLSKIGQAIIDSKVFVCLLSEKSITSKYCQDELALAYISNKPIFPVSLEQASALVPKMDTGMRLQLAGMNWVTTINESDRASKYAELLQLILKALEQEKEDDAKQEETVEETGNPQVPTLKKTQSRRRFYRQVVSKEDTDGHRFQPAEEFWKKHFKETNSVPWSNFTGNIYKEYKEELDSMYTPKDQDWLMHVLYLELEVEENEEKVDKAFYLNFCTVDRELLPFWVRVEEQARESYAMREVFNMDSSVRVEAIENLAKFKSAGVVDALRDLLDDLEPNVRAVAAISLAKTGANDRVTIKKLLKTLNDRDRLAREAGCISLGRLKALTAVSRLVHLWRNDVISTVREAAGLALEQIGGPEVEKAMHITRILSEEIRMLTQTEK